MAAAAAAQLNDDVRPSAVGTGGPVIGVDGLPSNVDHAWAKHDEVPPPAAQPLPCCLARPRFAGPGSPSDSAAREGAAWSRRALFCPPPWPPGVPPDLDELVERDRPPSLLP